MNKSQLRFKKKKKLGSYPYFSVVFSITISLFVIGLFGLMVLHTSKLTQIISENVEVQVYLDKFVTENDKIIINKTLSSRDFVLKKEDKPEIYFVSKEEAATQLIEETGQDFLELLGDNPLRDAFTIKISPDYHDPEKIENIKAEIESINGVFEVSYVKSLISTITENVTIIGFVLIGFSAFLILATLILINNTIKLALFSQRFLIRSMQLVGATKSFIRKPFLTRALLHGFLSGILSSALLFVLLEYANLKIDELKLIQDQNKIYILFGSLVVLGTLVGLISTYRSMNKYLKLSLDQLY
ncbi:permease-like cell division protein FtsX [Fulvivirgaceae bacterium BMA10]|uniref:Cell division protein FtsX n=1 Tax=Splendidivirga corallicola TaxID=3051826 RepID=A0ABT8KGZ6_9BACT|nr:permease-like cell division protein FtsX [Fulvivirgaceae bacterium BMA10]